MKLIRTITKGLAGLIISTALASCGGGGGMGDFSTINRTVQNPNPTSNFDLTENTIKGSYDPSNYDESEYNDYTLDFDSERKTRSDGYVDAVTVDAKLQINPTHINDTGVETQWANGWTGKGTTINVIDDINNKRSIPLHLGLEIIRTGGTNNYSYSSKSSHSLKYKITTNISHGDLVASIAGGNKKTVNRNVTYDPIKHSLISCNKYQNSCLGFWWKPESRWYKDYYANKDGFEIFTKDLTLVQAPGVAKDASITKSNINLSGRVSFNETMDTLYGHIENSNDFDAINLSLGVFLDGITYNDLVNSAEDWNITNPKGVYVIAAGNSGAPCTEKNFANCNLLAVDLMLDPTLGDQVIIAGATKIENGNKSKATYSNSAGVTKDRYLMASGDCGYVGIEGTSCAAPRITGGAAVLKSKFPNLTGEQASDILLLTGDKDIDDDGIDDFSGVSSIFGHGEMDLNQALSPVGTLQIAQSSTANTVTKQEIGNTQLQLSGVFSPSTANTNAVVGLLDGFDRIYPVSMKHFIHNRQSHVGVSEFLEERNGVDTNTVPTPAALLFADVSNNNTSVDFNIGERTYGFVVNPYKDLITQGGESLDVVIDHKHSSTKIAVSKNNPLNFSAEEQFTIKGDATELAINLGVASENKTFLGSQGFGALEHKDHTTTLYGDLSVSKNVGVNTQLVINTSIGQTNLEFENEGFVSASPIITNAFNIGMINYDEERKMKTAVVLDAPLKVVDGQLNLNTVSGYTAAGDYRNESQSIDLDDGSRDYNLSFYFDKEIDDNKNFGLKATVSDSGAISGAAFFGIKF